MYEQEGHDEDEDECAKGSEHYGHLRKIYAEIERSQNTVYKVEFH